MKMGCKWCKTSSSRDSSSGNESLPRFDEIEVENGNQSGDESLPIPLDNIHPSSQSNIRTMTTTDYEVAVAIDFGTTFTGYAYSYKDEPDNIFLNENWGRECGMESFKTPTCICIDNSQKFVDFGYRAQQEYQNEDSNNKYQLYQKFKMQMHEKRKEISSTTGLKITSDTGEEIDGKAIFAEALKYIKNHALGVIRDAASITCDDHVLWVLTVPAIWTDHEKMFMKEAAVKAGLVSNANSDKLLIALEPEAASLFCRKNIRFKHQGEMRNLLTGDKYIVIDAGGGTVDIAIHEINSDGRCVEIHEPSGIGWAGDVLNQKFDKLLTRVLGADFVNFYKSEYSWNWFDLMCQFETKKNGYQDNNFRTPITLSTGANFHNSYEKKMGRTLKEALANTRDQGLWLNKYENLQIGGEQLKVIFDSAVKEIINHIQQLVSNVHDIDVMLVVGGFGSCKYLFKSIKEKFESMYAVLQPEQPVLAVVKGAVLFAHDPDFIKHRISPCTYALEYQGPIPQRNKDTSRVTGGFYRCLQPIIEKGEPVEINTVIERYAQSAEDHMNTAEIELYSTTSEFDENPLANSNTKVGKVVVRCPSGVEDRTITINFIFGGTSITVNAKNSVGEETEAVFRFC